MEDRLCVVHTQHVDKGDGKATHLCWIPTDCSRPGEIMIMIMISSLIGNRHHFSCRTGPVTFFLERSDRKRCFQQLKTVIEGFFIYNKSNGFKHFN